MSLACRPGSRFPAAVLAAGLFCVLVAGVAASPAQLVASFTKDDCTPDNTLCPATPGGECDDVGPVDPTTGERPADTGGRVQYVLFVTNDSVAKWAMQLDDFLPDCARINCTDPCVDTTCDGSPDSGPVHVAFDKGGSAAPPACDEASNSLGINDIALEDGEVMEIRFCADLTAAGSCCNQATLRDPSGASHPSMDAQTGAREMCVQVDRDHVFWKDDCGPGTGEPECDDIGRVDADGDTIWDQRRRNAPPPSSWHAVKWVLHFENLDTVGKTVRITDYLPIDETVSCAPADDPTGQAWGCFEIVLDGDPVPPGPDDVCQSGGGGYIDLSEDVPAGATLEVRFCTRINDLAGPLVCNNDASARFDMRRVYARDNLDGDREVCIEGDGPPGCRPLGFPSAITTQGLGDCRLLVGWDPATGGEGAVVYDLYRDTGTPVPLDAAHLVAADLTGTSFEDSVAWGATYSYRVVARDECTDPGPQQVPNGGGDSAPDGPLPITFPTDVNVSTVGDCELLVEWEAGSSGQATLVYDLYRDTGTPVPLDAAHLVAADLTGLSHLDTVTWGPAYSYRVVARDRCTDPGPQEEPNGGGDSPPEDAVDGTPPGFEGVTDTEDGGFCTVLVHWDESTAVDDCSGIEVYTIYRDNGVAHAGRTLVGTSPSTPYEDTVPGNGVWVYVVRAVNGAGMEEQNEKFVQESEGSCQNNFPRDAGMKKGKNIDPPNADKQDKMMGGGVETGSGLPFPGRVRVMVEPGDLRISWEGSEDEGGVYPITYSILRGELAELQRRGYTYDLLDPLACGIGEHEYVMEGQVDGESYYYVVVPVSGDNATYGYDWEGTERLEAPVCE